MGEKKTSKKDTAPKTEKVGRFFGKGINGIVGGFTGAKDAITDGRRHLVEGFKDARKEEKE